MPLSKSLRHHRQPRTKCSLCHNLDPRGHSSSAYQAEAKEGRASLSLVLDTLRLARTRVPIEGGCRFCNVLITALNTFRDDWKTLRGRVLVDIKEMDTIKVGVDGERWKHEKIELYAAAGSRAPWPTLGPAHHIPSNSGSDDTFNFIRRCIQDCLTNSKHATCRPPPKVPLVTPRRLLDVGRVSAPIRLIDTQGKPFQYAALSHCWGSSQTFTATKSNWNQLVSSISWDAFPPLFQDAIIITRQLGLRYIWIDSLCIIQDSTRDWETESSKMGGIYEHSYVTIAATASGDGSARCLFERQKAVKIEYTNTAGKEFGVRARNIPDHHPDTGTKTAAKPSGPLTTRAWALQEHVLSTRILHYTTAEVLFECKTSCRCECAPTRKVNPTTPSLIPKAIAKKGANSQLVWSAWHRVVEEFSQRSLTVPTDKLPAISGIASKIKGATGSAYIAGIWKDNVASDLLWSSLPDAMADVSAYASEQYRAPSFSWASLNVRISYYTPDPEENEVCTSTITLLSSSVSLAGLNPLGTISAASIKLRGPCVQALLSSAPKDNTWEYTLLIKGTSAIAIIHDCMLVEEEVSGDSGESEKTVRRAHSQSALSTFKAPVLCLSVARYDSWISGLVLGISDRSPGAWARLGTFSAGADEVFNKGQDRDLLLV